ncbi:hypothetical protein GN316_18185 [Xylophilus sp. Kf1]|nr:hypothetical protein [Xylophilus sp. Kf1]
MPRWVSTSSRPPSSSLYSRNTRTPRCSRPLNSRRMSVESCSSASGRSGARCTVERSRRASRWRTTLPTPRAIQPRSTWPRTRRFQVAASSRRLR